MSEGGRAMDHAAIAAQKRELVAQLLKRKGLVGASSQVIPPRANRHEWPLSFVQQRLWFLDRLEPASPRYNTFTSVRLQGRLDVGALEEALAEILRRHEALRARFAEEGGEPVQRIAPAAPAALSVVDRAAQPAALRDRELERLATEEARRPFDLAQGPLLRGTLVRLAEDEHVLMLSLHHIVSDAWSLGLLQWELAALYRAFREGRPSPLGAPPIQYADFAAWQRDQTRGDVLDAQLGYWRRQLAGLEELDLDTDRPRPPVQSFGGAWRTRALDGRLADGLKALSQREGATLFMTLLAGFQALLHRYTGQTDLAVGSPVANRNRAELEGLIGCFANMLVLRADLSGDPSFRELLRRAREAAVAGYANQDVPFEKLVEELQPDRDLARHPLFQVAFALQIAAPTAGIELPDLAWSSGSVDNGVSKFDLTLYVGESERSLTAAFEYSTDLFVPDSIDRMLRHYERLLQGAVARPDARVSELPLLEGAERHQALVEWNSTRAEYPRDATVHEAFDAQAERTPDAAAVAFEGRALSYGELRRRSNRLAHRLRGLGVGSEVRVGICVERSLDLVVGMLAILKAGGAYVPLDPEYPQERIRFMVEDSGLRVLVTQASLRGMLGAASERVVCVDGDEAAIGGESDRDPAVSLRGDNLAYVIYTSGSTGVPKGVGVTHRAIGRLVLNTDYVRLGAADRVAQCANASFDAATFEIWGALLNGARVVVLRKEVAISPDELARRIRADGVTTLFLTTALFNQMAREVPDGFAPLRHLLFGGEAVDPGWVREVLERGRPERLLHVYGPTECTTFATWHRVEEVASDAATVPIGRPIANTDAYVLDAAMNPVPVGVRGELFIGGDGLARGYLGRPDLTAERFVPNPFGPPGDRLYRTGDLVRCRPDGAVEFLRRRDHQVKIRGFRIELGEVEAALARHEAVADSVVLVRDDGGERRLVAYVVPVAGSSLGEPELRARLKERLPDYMVPSVFVPMDALPLTPNGKIDRSALPKPAATSRAGGVAPRTPTEQAVARIWCEVLGVEEVGVHDNFFELGGHSLLATRITSRVRAAFSVEVALRTLFEAPTVADLAEHVDTAVWLSRSAAAAAAGGEGREVGEL